MISEIKKILSSKFPPVLVDDLVESYEVVVLNFRKEDYPEVIGKSGRFAENVFRILNFLDKGIVINEVKNMSKIEGSINQNTNYSDSIRLIIPRVIRSIVYTLRSKRDSIHVKETIPDFMDANLNMTSINWVISELLRYSSVLSSEEIEFIIKELMKKDYALLQVIEGEICITKELGAKNELLLILFNSKSTGMTRKEIGKAVRNYAPSTITTNLQKQLKARLIFLATSGRFHITDSGENYISDKILTF